MNYWVGFKSDEVGSIMNKWLWVLLAMPTQAFSYSVMVEDQLGRSLANMDYSKGVVALSLAEANLILSDVMHKSTLCDCGLILEDRPMQLSKKETNGGGRVFELPAEVALSESSDGKVGVLGFSGPYGVSPRHGEDYWPYCRDAKPYYDPLRQDFYYTCFPEAQVASAEGIPAPRFLPILAILAALFLSVKASDRRSL